MCAMHVDYLCRRLKTYEFVISNDPAVMILNEMISKIKLEHLCKSDEFIGNLCKKIDQYELISDFEKQGIPYFYDYVNS